MTGWPRYCRSVVNIITRVQSAAKPFTSEAGTKEKEHLTKEG